ncbi:MAG: hypothetical protein B7Z06_10225 [Flavobacteriales bacterium 32-35-8]|nr:MAG: hypothetical protein B7Z06_10225 [Flavobacteriales bacterium 32-35-8]
MLHKAFSVALALLVLVSTMSFTVEKHFCGNTLVETAVFTEAKGCGMDMTKLQTVESEKNNCCKNEVEVVKGQDKLKITTFDDLKYHQQLFFASYVYAFVNLFEGLSEQIIPHKNYSPPNLVADIQVLDQVFII